MPLITDYNQVKEIYEETAESEVVLPCFCTEDRETLESILSSALELSKEIGVEDIPIIVAWTSRYPERSQMKLITTTGDPILGTRLMFSDLKIFMDDRSPYRKLKVLTHLDHAYPWLDYDVLIDFVENFSSVMCDASERPFEENIKITSEYVEKVKGKVLVEGAVDEVCKSQDETIQNKEDYIKKAVRFIEETGVDIIVPNVGTEHRSTTKKIEYDSNIAQAISQIIGKKLCLHGTSSVNTNQFYKLSKDGFIKINIFTILALRGGQALVDKVLKNLGNIFSEQNLQEYISKGCLSEKVLDVNFGENIEPIKPKLDFLANPKRRDIWFAAVKDTCKEFLIKCNYKNFKK